MTFDMEQIVKSKQEYRKRLAAQPIEEKLRLLEELRRRTLAVRASRGKLRHVGLEEERQ